MYCLPKRWVSMAHLRPTRQNQWRKNPRLDFDTQYSGTLPHRFLRIDIHTTIVCNDPSQIKILFHDNHAMTNFCAGTLTLCTLCWLGNSSCWHWSLGLLRSSTYYFALWCHLGCSCPSGSLGLSSTNQSGSEMLCATFRPIVIDSFNRIGDIVLDALEPLVIIDVSAGVWDLALHLLDPLLRDHRLISRNVGCCVRRSCFILPSSTSQSEFNILFTSLLYRPRAIDSLVVISHAVHEVLVVSLNPSCSVDDTSDNENMRGSATSWDSCSSASFTQSCSNLWWPLWW